VTGPPAASAPVPQAQLDRVGENGQFGLLRHPGDLETLVGGASHPVARGGQLRDQGAAAPVEHPCNQGKEDESPQQEAGPEEHPAHPVAPVTRSRYRRGAGLSECGLSECIDAHARRPAPFLGCGPGGGWVGQAAFSGVVLRGRGPWAAAAAARLSDCPSQIAKSSTSS